MEFKDIFMPRITDIFMVDTPRQIAPAIRATAAESELPGLIGSAFARLGSYIEREGLFPADSPFVRIVGADPAALQITIGLAVSSEDPRGDGEIEKFIIPAGKKIFCYYQGDSSLMSPVCEEMRLFAEEHGCRVEKGVYEYYLNGTEVGLDKLLTRIVISLK